ncbi:hypothetical protein DPMN_049617 [Dreissena polymorpha]|uniref:Alpha-2-macroglobulin bait region domain-containing protein n=1 Tax=Dreissena polymorpha TaxID=45954 RepID=A0A9D4HKL5_DREPO|nr:hypothetical protein DPMN_049617 [Dreissena polymorpha]
MLQATHDMAPKSQVLVMYVRADWELVADALSINVDGAFMNKVRPGDLVTWDYMN